MPPRKVTQAPSLPARRGKVKLALMTTPAAAEPRIPYAPTLLALEVSRAQVIRRAVEILFGLAHSPGYAALVDPGADEVSLRAPGSFGVFMGYDFHITPEGPKLVEINTNAGGALLNGLLSLRRCDPGSIPWICCPPPAPEAVERRLVETFRAEFEAVRGPEAELASVAIVDDGPSGQFLYPEFLLFVELFRRHGIEATIADTRDLEYVPGEGVRAEGRRVDLVYLRDTDFSLSEERSASLRRAYLAGEVVVTPTPREHHLLADKRRLAVFSDPEALRTLGLPAEDAAFLARIVPRTVPLDRLSFEEAWRTRRRWVFKPARLFGSKAVYRGDKISRRRLEELYRSPEGFVAQELVDPGSVEVETPEGLRRMKFDVRAYVYRDEILLFGARVYEGQVTNFRTPGGGFSAICLAKEAS
ncbi:MAG: hypothetical protein KatS3mg076_3270 [Candidatus Binatia bacterium]|nr:MAG: hypothetical protein KatS3mg076_3270 [Candidatus Binatia bacterium]